MMMLDIAMAENLVPQKMDKGHEDCPTCPSPMVLNV